MFKIGDRGDQVKQFQEALLELGAALPRWGADADFGGETASALVHVLFEQGRAHPDDPDKDVADDQEVALVYDLLARRRAMAAQAVPEPDQLVDRRPIVGPYGDYGPRPWDKITGACLHQTACVMSGSRDPARMDKVTAHFLIARAAGGHYKDGDVLWLHDFNRLVAHGNGFNRLTWGVEVDGLFAGVEGDPRTVWDDRSTRWVEQAVSITDAQVHSLKQLVRWGKHVIDSLGGMMNVIVPHRCSSRSRANDPGSRTWGVARELMAELGLHDGGPGFCIHDGAGGKPIPETWDPSRKGIPY